MLQRLKSYAAILGGIALLFVGPAMFICGYGMILFATYPEILAIKATGLPASHASLNWSDWREGAGNLRASTLVNDIDENAAIVAHRVGTADGLSTRFTFYQAKYALPDGTIQIAHAEGPVRLISFRTKFAILVTSISAVLGVVLISIGFNSLSRHPSS